MSKPLEIESTEQFSNLLKSSRIVVADCKLSLGSLCVKMYPAIVTVALGIECVRRDALITTASGEIHDPSDDDSPNHTIVDRLSTYDFANHVKPVYSGLAIARCRSQYTPGFDLRHRLTSFLQFMPTGAGHARRSHRSTSNSHKRYRCPMSPPSSRSTPNLPPASGLLKNMPLPLYPPSSSSVMAMLSRRSRVATRSP